ncbi:hypothetical protein CPAR01_16681 [Colletotrichum paranaense]|uniref:Uncharacterized protein n=1 Tax=Colletotrichum paranaense TaxID=1914294 RepID=A0ABQ9RVK6_9PEZI|nr:uncharacterized protein CPAR01_16681 [Colletotrichum paranaense]KAK1515560.1 hypothetical protein CPAR01_16681 [Colletotrichum paranaense]
MSYCVSHVLVAWVLLAVAAADEPIPDAGSVGAGAIAGIVLGGVCVVGLLAAATGLARNRMWNRLFLLDGRLQVSSSITRDMKPGSVSTCVC